MATQTRVKTARMDLQKTHGLDGDALIRLYRVMYLSRKLDDREIQLNHGGSLVLKDGTGSSFEAAAPADLPDPRGALGRVHLAQLGRDARC